MTVRELIAALEPFEDNINEVEVGCGENITTIIRIEADHGIVTLILDDPSLISNRIEV